METAKLLLGEGKELNAFVSRLLDDIGNLKAILHAADLADLLEALPNDERLVLWPLVKNEKRGQTLVEVSETVWDTLIKEMSDKDLLKAMRTLHVDEQAYLAEYLPRNLMGRLLTSLDPDQRARVREVIQYGRDTVGQMMDFELVTVRADVTLATVQRYLRYRKNIPDATDKIFVIDRKNTLLGELPLTAILLNAPDTQVFEVMESKSARSAACRSSSSVLISKICSANCSSLNFSRSS